MRRARARTAILILTAVALSGCAGSEPDTSSTTSSAIVVDESLDLQAAFLAKSLCTGLWVSGREREEFLANDILLGRQGLEHTSLEVDDAGQSVLARVGELSLYRAEFHPGHGCTTLPLDGSTIGFDPIPIVPAPTEAATGLDPFDVPLVDGTQRDALDAAARLAFSDEPGVHTRALVALHGGRLAVEQYDGANGFDADSVNLSWSMGKSIASALIGTAVQRGWLTLEEPAPIPAWQGEGDPRSAIRVIDLLQMSSGLAFDRIEPDGDFFRRANHHFMVYFGIYDVSGFVTSFELRSTPGTVGLYRNSDPLALITILRALTEAHGEEFLSYPQRALFDRIGATTYVLERDGLGTPIISGYDHATARDWARFGQLHLQDGLWNGDRILPEGWSEIVSAPAPGWANGEYGGLFWRNADRAGGRPFPSLPESAYYAAGAFGQFTIVVPEHDLVVVRMGYDTNAAAASQALDRAIGAILEQLGVARRAAA